MDISDSLPILTRHGLQTDAIQELENLARKLPKKNLKVRLTGLDDEQSLVLMSSKLRILSKLLGSEFTHPDVIGLAEYEVLESPQKVSADAEKETQEVHEGMAS